jgi:hypothetical protein
MKFCIKEFGRKKVNGIPDCSITFSACICKQVVMIPGSASAPKADNFTINPNHFSFAWFTKLFLNSTALGSTGVRRNILSLVSHNLNRQIESALNSRNTTLNSSKPDQTSG